MMKRLVPTAVLFIALGFGVMLFGFVYDITYAGIPYQDAPPDLLAQYEAVRDTTTTIFMVGAGLSSVGSLLAFGAAVRLVLRLLRPSAQEER